MPEAVATISFPTKTKSWDFPNFTHLQQLINDNEPRLTSTILNDETHFVSLIEKFI